MKDKKANVFITGLFIFAGFCFVFLFIIMVLLAFWSFELKEIKTNEITECNDVDGDIIEGNIICYKTIQCSTKNLKFMNAKECKEFLE